MAMLNFQRELILQTAPSLPGTLAVFPLGKNKQQKLIVGDSNGVLQSFSIRKGNIVSVFKHLPTGKPFTSIVLGDGEAQTTKAFVGSGQDVVGMNKKGAEFYRFTINLTEAISRIYVKDLQLYTACKYAFSRYSNSMESGYYLCSDKINGMANISVSDDVDLSVLGCADSYLRAVDGSKLYYETSLSSSVTCVHTSSKKKVMRAGQSDDRSVEIFAGLDDGTVAQVFLDENSIRRGWNIQDPSRTAGVTSICKKLDFVDDGLNDVIIGREDGSIEVYGTDFEGLPELHYSRVIGEYINTIDGGFITSTANEDFVVQTYSGKVLSFHKYSQEDHDFKLSEKDPDTVEDTVAKTKKLQSEVDKLKIMIDNAKKKMAKSENDILKNQDTFVAKEKFQLDSATGLYYLSFEATTPLVSVLLKSDVEIEVLQDTKNNGTAGSITASKTDSLFTFRCQEASKRVSMLIRPTEGSPGTIKAFLLPDNVNYLGLQLSFQIKPLCLHKRIHDAMPEGRVMSELRVIGSFNLEEIHSWTAGCLPDLSPVLIGDKDRASYTFHAKLLDTYVLCDLRSGEAIFASDSIIGIATIKDSIYAEATALNQRVDISFDINPTSLKHFCEMVWPKLEYQMSIEKKVKGIEALREIEIQEGDTSFLTQEYQDILNNAELIKEEYDAQPSALKLLNKLTETTYIAWHKFRGLNNEAKIPQFRRQMEHVTSSDELHKVMAA